MSSLPFVWCMVNIKTRLMVKTMCADSDVDGDADSDGDGEDEDRRVAK